MVFDPNNDIVLKQGTTVIGIVKQSEKAYTYSLSQNYPNPFNPTTTINFSIPEKAKVTIKVFDVLGRLVSLLVDAEKLEGSYKVKFDGTNFASGVYYYQIDAQGTKTNFTLVKKMVLVK